MTRQYVLLPAPLGRLKDEYLNGVVPLHDAGQRPARPFKSIGLSTVLTGEYFKHSIAA